MQINKTSKMNNFQVKNQPAFSGSTAELGKKVLSSNSLKKVSDSFEYSKFQMSLASMMVVLYGATILPRYCQATDKHDRREILTRDVLSITSILFFAKALSKGFSRVLSDVSGFALMNKPVHKDQKIATKILDYFKPNGDTQVLSSNELKVKYSNLKNYENGISDFFKFIEDQSGDIKKVLSFDKGVRENAKTILGQDVKKVSADVIKEKFAKAKGSQALENIYKAFEATDNKFVNKAKTMNSMFGFLSTVLLVPAFMIWIEKFNEKMTKKAIAADIAKAEAAKKNQPADNATSKLGSKIK